MAKNEEEISQILHKSQFSRTVFDINNLKKFLKNGCNHGICGNHNLGNECYMNSSLACLSNCIELTTYFLSGKFKEHTNKKNSSGMGGELANAWNNLLQQYWNSNIKVGNQSYVKICVGKKIKNSVDIINKTLLNL